jgi:uncharacterized cupredoxin-like copper-binding protein
VHLPQGQPVVLHLVNTGRGGHNFAAPEFFAAATIDPEDAGKIVHGADEVPGHGAVDDHLVGVAGHYALRCTHPLHSSFGMHGEIDVG